MEKKKVNKVGRPDRFDIDVKPYLSEIEQWMINKRSDKFIADSLKIGYSTWFKYKNERQELIELIETIPTKRISRVNDVYEALFKAATGYEYKEEKIIIEGDFEVKELSKQRKEIYKKHAQPNPTAAEKYLNVMDENYIPNKAYYGLKEKELNWKMERAEKEAESWEAVTGEDLKDGDD